MIKELKAFLLRGDVLSLAVAVIIGGAFSKIVDSLVADIITPILGLITGGVDFSALKFGLGGEAAIGYGKFIQAIINFITIGIVLYSLIKASGKNSTEVK